MDIETDGSLDPQAALREAAEILIKYLAIFTDADRVEALRDQGAALVAGAEALGADGGAPGAGGMDDILIEELELGVRSYNCLKRAGIQTVGDLVQKSESELAAIPNFGRKSIEEVIDHERIQTSEAKAKAVKPELERLITLAKKGDGHSRRLAMARLGQDKFVVYKLFEEIAPRYADREGGYTRILKLGPRKSDSTEMVFLELV